MHGEEGKQEGASPLSPLTELSEPGEEGLPVLLPSKQRELPG